jgi:hypothetical protein
MDSLKATVSPRRVKRDGVLLVWGRWCALYVRQFKLFFLIEVYAKAYTDIVKIR